MWGDRGELEAGEKEGLIYLFSIEGFKILLYISLLLIKAKLQSLFSLAIY